MTALEMTKQCALAMGYEWRGRFAFLILEGGMLEIKTTYDPLRDDAQAMALVKRFKLSLNPQENGVWCEAVWFDPKGDDEIRITAEGVNRSIVQCVALVKKAGKV